MVKTEVLKELGFTDGEIKVYFSLFELGETTVGPISKKSGVTHAKVYPILSKLIEKGLVSYVEKEGIKHFAATNPNSLLEFVENKVRSLEEEKSKIKEMIPTLLAKQKAEEKVQYSRVYEGFKGLRALFYELFGNNKEKAEVNVLGLNEILKRADFQNFFLFYHTIRKKHNIKLKLILNKDMKPFFTKKYMPTNYYNAPDKIKFVDVGFPTGLFIFKDHVINVIADEKVSAFDIKSKQNADRYRQFFESIWKTK